MAPKTFDAAVEAARRNLGSMAKGDAGPSIALWSQSDDVVLANPLGPPILGFPLVAAETARVASVFVGGEPPEFDEVTRWASEDLGYVVAIEHAQVQRAGSDELVSAPRDFGRSQRRTRCQNEPSPKAKLGLSNP